MISSVAYPGLQIRGSQAVKSASNDTKRVFPAAESIRQLKSLAVDDPVPSILPVVTQGWDPIDD